MAKLENLENNLSARVTNYREMEMELANVGARTKRAKELREEMETLARLIEKTKASIEKKKAEMGETEMPKATKANANPAEKKMSAREMALAAARENNETVTDLDVSGNEAPKRRGRPRKNVETAEPVTEASEPKRRGRPRKNAETAEPVTEASEPKRRGRPRKNAETAEPVTEASEPKRRGRPRKNVDSNFVNVTNGISNDDKQTLGTKNKALVNALENMGIIPVVESEPVKRAENPEVIRVNVETEIRNCSPDALLNILSDAQMEAIFQAKLKQKKAENKARTLENPVISRKRTNEGRLILEGDIKNLFGTISGLAVVETREFVDADGQIHEYQKNVRPLNMHSAIDIAEFVQGPSRIADARHFETLALACKRVAMTFGKFVKAEDKSFDE